MRILVSMRIMENHTYVERRDAISHDWGKLFTVIGIVPILVPNSLLDVSDYFDMGARGLLLTGGDSLGTTTEPTQRDSTERALVATAIANAMPIFAACRGFQFVNRFFGGVLERTLPEPHVGEHPIILKDGSMLVINSYHNDGVLSTGLAADLEPFACSRAGVVEAYRHKSEKIIGIQWHPERPNPSSTLDTLLLKEWLAQCE